MQVVGADTSKRLLDASLLDAQWAMGVLIDESIILEIIWTKIWKYEIFVVPLSPKGDVVGMGWKVF